MSRTAPVAAGLAALCWLVPGVLAAQGAPPAAQPAGSRPNAIERPWSGDPDSPYTRAQAVAGERVLGTTGLERNSPESDTFHSATLAAFRTESSIWRREPNFVGYDWYSDRYPTLLAAPRSPTGAGLWLVFPAPWTTPRVGAPGVGPSRPGGHGSVGAGRGRTPGAGRGRGTGRSR